jgi:magnesium-transporting ATPase (P-type)
MSEKQEKQEKQEKKSVRLDHFKTISINKNDNNDNIKITLNNSKDSTELNISNEDVVELFVINKENYMSEVNISKIKYVLIILLILFAAFTIITSIFAIQYYYETRNNILFEYMNDIFKANLYYFWIMILLNIIFSSLVVILIIYSLFFSKIQNIFMKIFIYLIILGVAVLNFIINYYLTLYPIFDYEEKEKNNQILPKYYFNLITYVVFIPICLLILILFYYYSHDNTSN